MVFVIPAFLVFATLLIAPQAIIGAALMIVCVALSAVVGRLVYWLSGSPRQQEPRLQPVRLTVKKRFR